jgi:hypothetical protein
MAEATIDTDDANETAAMQSAARQLDRARMIQIGSFHFAMVTGALIMWGAAETWAQVTGWAVAHFAAVAGALVAGFVIPSTIHEWGHFAGARLVGGVSPVFEEPRRHFFMFEFVMDRNDTRQFLWMSWGGILAPWVAVVLALIFVPLGIVSGAVLLATLVSKAVSVAVFEVPVALRTRRSGEPGAELGKQAMGGGLPRSRRVGAAVGAACLALLWLAL